VKTIFCDICNKLLSEFDANVIAVRAKSWDWGFAYTYCKGKGITWICIAPCRDHISKASGMTRVKGSHSFTCTPRVHPLRNEPYLPLPSQPKLVLIYRPRRDGRLSWPWVAGLVIYRNKCPVSGIKLGHDGRPSQY